MARGEAIQPDTDFSDRTGIGGSQLEVGFDRLGALDEQGYGRILPQVFQLGKVGQVRQDQRWNGEKVFARHVQHGTTGHQQLEPGTGGQQIYELGSRTHDLFKVVQQQQQLLLLQFSLQVFQQRLTSDFTETERLGNGGDNERVITDGSEVHEIRTVGE